MPEFEEIPLNSSNFSLIFIPIKMVISPKFHFCLNANLNFSCYLLKS